ncbi:MAG TPA: HPP family protein [Rhizobacter sp.]|nr:HPP family protein [Rhizobacter sp.]
MTSTSLADQKSVASRERSAVLRSAAARWLRSFWPAPIAVNRQERLRALGGAAVGIIVTGVLCHLFGAALLPSSPWLIAPLGASAVLVFAVPASPMAQPWPVIGGNTLSALVGIACARWIAPPELAAALAVGLAIGLMFVTRSLHPPGGAAALFTSLGGIAHFEFALFPVLLNSLLMVAAGIAYNNATGRRYPHAPPRPAAQPTPDSPPDHVVAADLDAVLARYNQVLDINRDDLQALLEQTHARTYERKLAEIRCADIMSRDVVTAEFGTPLQEAWALMRERHVKALPVIDRTRRIVGILTQSDFLRAADLEVHEGFDDKLKKFLRSTGVTHTTKPEVVGQIMTRKVRVASEGRRLVDLVPLFGGDGHHHIPIIGEHGKLVGIITQTDLVAAMCRTEEQVSS